MSSSYAALGGYLQRHAYINVWCTPNQDKSAIFKPAKLTPINGARNVIKVMWRQHRLPDNNSQFHVYQIGQVHPTIIGLADAPNVWVNVQDLCNQQDVILDIYAATGYQLPRYNVWYLVTPEKDLIIAVKFPEGGNLPVNLNTEDMYFRIYRNAYFDSTRADLGTDNIRVIGKFLNQTQDILDIQNSLTQYRTLGGHCYCFINGMLVDTINLLTAKVGDHAEFVYDASIKQVLRLPVTDLPSFVSTLDGLHKYLIHNPVLDTTIDYFDDIDFFIVKAGTSPGRFNGLFYHRNSEKAVRMVTHQDYSIPVPFVSAYLQSVSTWVNVEQLEIVLHIRKAGYDRPLVFEHNRIRELYKLHNDEILSAMTGIDATVDVWKAENLENSSYAALMSANLGQITTQNVQDAYGYNAASKILADSPIKTRVQSSVLVVDIPVGLQTSCTVYEYDENGYLLEWHTHSNSSLYSCYNQNTRLVEVIPGVASDVLDIRRDLATDALDLNYNYRFYTCDIVNGVSQNNWRDVTNTAAYGINNNIYQWAVNPGTNKTMVIGNKRHLAYSFSHIVDNGVLDFTIREYRGDYQAYRVLDIPLGNLDIFLNGRSLINGLDYHVDFPRVVITNKEYLIDAENTPQVIAVRHTGFCDPVTMQYIDPPDAGFIEYGALSTNNRFDVRDDKITRIVINGSLYHRDELQFGEDDFEVRVTDSKNGAPYAIRDVFVPMNAYLDKGTGTYVDPTFVLRQRSQQVDQAISDYLTLKIPEKEPTEPSAIPDLYKTHSPFISRIINDLRKGILTDSRFVEHYSDEFVRSKCAPYEWLLDYDPITINNRPNKNFVVIHPHMFDYYIEMDIYLYRFLNRVVNLYGNGVVDLSSFVSVAPIA